MFPQLRWRLIALWSRCKLDGVACDASFRTHLWVYHWLAMHHGMFSPLACMLASLCEDCSDCTSQVDATRSYLVMRFSFERFDTLVQCKSSQVMTCLLECPHPLSPFFSFLPLHLLFLSIYRQLHHVAMCVCLQICLWAMFLPLLPYTLLYLSSSIYDMPSPECCVSNLHVMCNIGRAVKV